MSMVFDLRRLLWAMVIPTVWVPCLSIHMSAVVPAIDLSISDMAKASCPGVPVSESMLSLPAKDVHACVGVFCFISLPLISDGVRALIASPWDGFCMSRQWRVYVLLGWVLCVWVKAEQTVCPSDTVVPMGCVWYVLNGVGLS